MHHRVSKQYINVYYPYLPVIAILTIAAFWGFLAPRNFQQNILGKATNLSTEVLLKNTNTERQKNNLPILKLNTELSIAAQNKARDMVDRDYWSHNTPDGTPPWIFIEATNYAYQKAGENLAYGFADSESTVTAWMRSPGHRANILDNAYQDIGFGFADSENFEKNGPSTIVVAMYGRPLISTPAIAGSSDKQLFSPSTQSENEVLDTNPKNTTFAQLLSSNSAYISLFTIVIMSVCIGIWAGSHLRQIKGILHRGKELVIHHPILDIVMLCSVLLAIVLNQTAGFIR